MKVLWICGVYLLIVFTTSSEGNSLVDPYICGQPSCKSTGKLKYQTSVIYQYSYNVTVDTWFAGASENRSMLFIEAGISLEFITECEGLLNITAVKMKDQDEEYPEERESIFAGELMNRTLRFAFHDGVITEICPHEGELEWTLNFKRGVLSLFQNTMARFDIDYKGIERDIHGTCDTTYHMQGQLNTSLIIMKKKDLTQCQDRYKYLSILQTVRYNFQSEYQTWPVLQSESRCRLVIDNKVYIGVQCRERHLFEPFSGKRSGAMTTVFQDLALLTELNKTSTQILHEKKEEWEVIKHRQSLLHQHTPTSRPGSGEVKSARDILKELCKIEEAISDSESQEIPDSSDGNDRIFSTSEETHGGEVVALWGGFVRACRALHHASLGQLLARASSICPQARKHVIDALPYIASIGSVELIKDMIIEGTINEETREDWLMSMAMIPRPQRDMIVSMKQLLEHNPQDKSISLTVSSMVHSYCRNSRKPLGECCMEEQNMGIIKIFQNNVLKNIHEGNQTLGRNEKDKISVSIKSLGNIGGFTKDFANTLMQMIEHPEIPLSVRLYSVEAFRRTMCPETRDYFLELFRKRSLDVEIRLASYLQVMRCPKYVIIRAIVQSLATEEINQVSSFVWSHLNNLGKSAIPSQVEKQGLLSGNTIPRPKHRPDIRKFSRNYEYGVFFDQYNAGGNLEANVIMSPDSYIPRSASVNLTVDMFGESINILELNIRAEGFEKYFENIFSNNGPLSRSKIEKKLHNLRIMRSTNQADEVKEKIDSLNFDSDAMDHRNPTLDLGMRVFGNEISYWNAEGDNEIFDAATKMNPWYHIRKILSGTGISYKKSSLFLDTSYSVPTGCGLPMTMNLMGTSVVNLKLSGSFSNTEGLFQPNSSVDFEGKVHPSMALNVAATMSVTGGGLGGTGIRLNTRLHTATALSTELKFRGGKTVALKVSMPHSKQEIFQAKSELIVLHGTREIQQTGINKEKIEAHTCSWKTLDYAIGIKMCATYEFPNVTNVEDAPYFLMAGPSRYLLSLEKVDPSAKVYSFLYTWEYNSTTKFMRFSFDTPGSKRKTMFNASMTSMIDSGNAALAYQSSENYLKAHAKYKNQPDHKFVELVLDIDGHKHFDAVMSLNVQDQRNGHIYIPRLYVAVNNERIMELAGTLKMAQKKGVSQCDVSVEFQTKRLASRLIGYITWNGPSKGANLRLDYQFLREKKENIKIEALLSNRESDQRKDFYGELGLNFTSYPYLNFFSAVKYMGTPHHAEMNMNLSSSRFTADNAKIHYSMARHRTIEGFRLRHHLKIAKPFLDMYHYYEEIGSLYTVNTTVVYDKSTNVGGLVAVTGKFYAPPGSRLYIDAGLNITLPVLTPMVLEFRVHEKRASEFDISAQGVWFTGLDASLVAVYQEKSSALLAMRSLKAIVSSTSFTEVELKAKYTQDNKQLDFKIKAVQGDDLYSVLGQFISYSEKNFTCYGQVDVISKTYSINLMADLFNDTNILADIHLDQLRDVHITYSNVNRPHVRRLNADVNWNSNRDPNQKVSVAMELLNKGHLNYAGSFLLFYPGKLINGEFDFLFKDWLCQWLVKMNWSPDDNILWMVKLFSEMETETVYALLSKMDTPFEGWKDTSLNLVWKYIDNLQSLSGNMTWEKERLAFALQGDYMLKTSEVYGEIRALVNSTIPTLPTVSAIAKHHHLWRKSADTLLSFEYNNDGMIMFNSSWKIDRGPNSHNISGRVGLKSPFQGYKSGLLVTKFMFNQKRDVQGLTHLDIEEKIYVITVDGHIRRFTNSMLIFNVTSPSPAATLMSGRLGFVDTDHHAVAMLETPNIMVGAELLVKLQSFQDFHVFSHIALPIDFLHDTMVIAKRSSEEIDLRLGWEKHFLGFTGIWHYNSLMDFQYLYKAFTPLQGFEENGLVLKNLYTEVGLDSEISVRLSKLKIGVAFLVRDNGEGILKIIEEKYMGIEPKFSTNVFRDFSSDIYIVIDTLYYPTIKFDAQLNKFNLQGEDVKEEVIKVLANLFLPNMTAITLNNKFILEDIQTLRNDLHIVTPFPQMKELKFYHTCEVILGEKYNLTYILLNKNENDWTENSLQFFYQNDVSDDEEEDFSHSKTAFLTLKSQLESLKWLNANLEIHVDASLTRVTANIDMPSCQLATKGQIELDETFTYITGSMNLTSPYVQPYDIRVEFKKDFSDVENTLVCGLQVKQGSQNNFLFSHARWGVEMKDHFKAKLHVSLLPVIPPSELALEFSQTSALTVLQGEATIGQSDMIYTLKAEQRPGFHTIALTSPHKGFKNMNLTGEVKSNKTIIGTFQNDAGDYDVNGNIISLNPLELVATIKPKKDGSQYTIRIKTTETKEKFSISASLIGAIHVSLNCAILQGNKFREISAQIFSTNDIIKSMQLKGRMELTEEKRVLIDLDADTPLQNLKTLKVNADLSLTSKLGAMICKYNTTNLSGENNVGWSFLPEDTFFKIRSHQTTKGETRSLDIKTFQFYNSTGGKSSTDFFTTGFHIDLDNMWKCGSNATMLSIGKGKATYDLHILLPKPNIDVHSFRCNLEKIQNEETKLLELSYNTDVTMSKAAVVGKYAPISDGFYTNITLDWGKENALKTICNKLKVRNAKNTFALDYALFSPMVPNQDTLKLKSVLNKPIEDMISVVGTLNYPENTTVFDIDLTYGGLKHTVGSINTTTPFDNIKWLATNARLSNTDILNENMVQLFWPNQSALLNSTHRVTKTQDDAASQSGVIFLEIPLSTIHVMESNYFYTQSDKWSNGNNTVFYNGDKLIEGLFKSVSDIGEKNLFRDTVDMSIDIEKWSPWGIHYTHQYDKGGDTDIKQASLYELHNATNFNVTGRLDIEPWNTGKQVKILVTQGERTVRFENNYESKEKEVFQGSKIQWARDVWLHYDINIINKTEADDEHQELKLSLHYPERSFKILANYHLQDTLLAGTADIDWSVDDENRTVRLDGKWHNPDLQDSTFHDVKFALMHPSFSKSVTVLGKYLSDPKVASNISIILDYSDYEDDILTFNSVLRDNSIGSLRDYRFEVDCKHPATNLDLTVRSEVNMDHKIYHFKNFYSYQKTLFSKVLRQNELSLDWHNFAVQYKRFIDSDWYNLNASFLNLPPEYKVSVQVNRTTGLDDGIWVLSTKDKSIMGHFNRSDDISYHLIGKVIDARSAELGAWRDFDDVTTVDISSYIRLNHSRLLTSQILWRPEMYQEIKTTVSSFFKDIYSQTSEALQIWKSVPKETLDILKNVWTDAKPKLRDFLSDLNDVHIVKEDLEEFQKFLSESYENNEFYTKDITEFLLHVLEQLSLKNHIESLPKIVNEIWHVMGDTGKSLRESITWITETIKKSYAQLIAKIDTLLEADLMEQVTNLLEAGILKYDSFMKDLHLNFVHYIEATWINTRIKFAVFWRNILKSMEPTFLKIAHYVETFVWNFAKEILDFFYVKTSELTENPYFSIVSSFSQDIDRFFKDMTNNDAITNVKKYSQIIMTFINDKIIVHIPFQKELKQIVSEILHELNKLQELKIVQYIKAKFWEAKSRLQWWYDYFKIGDALDAIANTLYKKITEVPKTALQIDEVRRKPKTNFIFDTYTGQLLWEQKLPVPWHAFNRTPDYTQVMEYKFMSDLMDTWFLYSSNMTPLAFLYEYKRYLDIYNILPPFFGNAVVTAQGTIVTLDRKVFTVTEPGLFLLTRDFLTGNFTVMMESNSPNKYNLVLLSQKDLIRIDLMDEIISVGESEMISLPNRVEEWALERDGNTLKIVHDKGLRIECDYLFKTCLVQIEGWYYSTLGGLFGTFNNEPYDDMLTPNGKTVSSIPKLSESWRLFDLPYTSTVTSKGGENATNCEAYFKNKISPLKSCFSMIDVSPFYEECMTGLDPCTLANAYREICMADDIPTRIPEKCMECLSPDNKLIEEGTFNFVLEVPNSTDVVFIVETHACNINIRKQKNVDLLIRTLEEKLVESGLTNNRYTVMGFGTPGKYKTPSYSVYYKNKLFMNSSEVLNAFDHLEFESPSFSNSSNYTAVAFQALSLASALTFRPGVSKTFFLFPCTRCVDYAFQLDYDVVHQVLTDSSVTLHIIMDGEFSMAKKRVAKQLYGIDNSLAYTVKDVRQLTGDAELRQHVRPPKNQLGFCASLAMETDGTIFSGKKLGSQDAVSRRVSNVLASRVAKTSRPCARVRCQCQAAVLRCTACPRPSSRPLSDISLSMWDSAEIEGFIDHFLDVTVPII